MCIPWFLGANFTWCLFKVCILVSVCLKTGVAVCVFLQMSFYGVKEQPSRERWARNSWAASAYVDMTWGLPVSSVVSDLLERILYFFFHIGVLLHVG